MATIQKVSGIDFANISKFDGVDISAVGSINFIGKPPTGNLLLDTSYGSGAEAAYSVRKLRTAYTGAAIQVQATTGGATAEIGFDVDNNLDTATLLAFAGTNEVGVSIWYDQSTNGNNAVQISVTQRPIVVAAGGALVKDNGKPAVDFDGANDWLDLGTNQLGSTELFADSNDAFSVYQYATIDTQGTVFSKALANSQARDYQLFYQNNWGYTIRGTANSYTAATDKRMLASFNWDGSNAAANFNGTSQTVNIGTAGKSTQDINIGSRSDGGFLLDGKNQEIIVYDSSKSTADQTSIESNIGDYYTQNQAPYLLDTYTGAAAGYSLRKLRTDYTGFAIKVQDNVGGATQTIGFNVFGELDTVSLAAYAGSNDVFVETWYDQSGSGNNVEQPSSALRPKIVSSGVVNVDANGKPQLNCTSDDMRGGPSYGGSDVSIFAVANMASNAVVLGGNGNNGVYIIAQSGISTDGMGGFGGETLYVDNVQDTAITRASIYNSMSPTGNHLMSAFATSSPASDLMIGYNPSGTLGMSTAVQEIILYTSNQSNFRTGIETNINTFYDIYTPTPDPLLLNLYPGSAAAYSLRKLNANYTGSAILVQDTVGGATKAIGFDANGDLDTAELLAYAGSNDVLVATWFDQSGSGNNAEQISSSRRPKIVSSGVVIVDDNGKPAVEFDGAADTLETSSNVISNSEMTLFLLRKFDDTSSRPQDVVMSSTNSGFKYGMSGSGKDQYADYPATGVTTWRSTKQIQELHSMLAVSSGGAILYIDGVLQSASGTAGIVPTNTNTLKLGSRNLTSAFFNGKIQETIIYATAQSSANRTNIEENIGGYYDIVLPGLLDENPGAAAAYSLRRLRQAYTGSAIQVQRADNVGGTTDIGFDSYGDLDTAALTTAAAGNSMVVTTWFDQSGNSNDATQGTSTARPKIYDGTTGVVTENGKPVINYNNPTTNVLNLGSALSSVQSVFQVLSSTRTVVYAPILGDSTAKDYHPGTSYQILRSGQSASFVLNGDNRINGQTVDFTSLAGRKPTSQSLLTLIHTSASGNVSSLSNDRDISGRNWDGNLQEVILYETNQSDNRPSIEDNVGDYYGIEIAGLLDQYSGAAAGYSLRKLSNSYTGFAVKVQDNVGGATQDIGFNADGELDTVALLAYAGSNDVFVETWYDQSGNGVNATQPSSGARPQIVSSGAVIVDGNGALTISYAASNDFMETALTLNTEPISVFAVNQTPNGSYSPIVGLGGTTAYLNLEIQNAQDANLKVYAGNGSTYTTHSSSTGTSTDVMLYSYSKVGNALNGYVNGAQEISATETKSSSGVLGFRVRSKVTVTYISEVVIYQSDQSANRTGIQDNINFFYDIY